MTAVGGIVLCGGKSRRMGRDKASLPFGGESLLGRVVRRLTPVAEPVVVVSAAGQPLPALPPDVSIVHDETADRGPLQGLLTGLRAMSGRDAAFLTACDAPFLHPEFVRRMAELLGDHAACVVEADGFRHPLAAVYRTAVIPVIERLLAADRRKLGGLFDVIDTRFVTRVDVGAADAGLWSLRNLNTLAEYEAALALADNH